MKTKRILYFILIFFIFIKAQSLQDIKNYTANDFTIQSNKNVLLSNPTHLGEIIVNNAIKEYNRGPHETGKNISFYPYYIDLYLDPYEAWCSEFVSWIYKVSGYSFTGGYYGGWMITNSQALKNWFKNNRKFIDRNSPEWNTFVPQAGDYIRYNNDNGGHSGLVRYVSNDSLYTVEGNVSNKVKLLVKANFRNYASIDGFGLRIVDLEAYFESETNTDNYNVQFYNKSFSRNSSINKIEWDFGDGTSSNENNPLHTYTNAGVYNVKLKVTNSTTSDSLTQSIRVPKERFTLSTNINGIGQISVSPSAANYPSGSILSCEATPETGWRFDYWTTPITNYWNPIEVQIDKDKIISATFSQLGKYVGNTIAFERETTTANRRCMPFTMPENGLIKSVTMFHSKGSGKMILAIYEGDSKPTNKIAETNETSVKTITGWQTVQLKSPVYVPKNKKIWLAWVYENNPGIRYTQGSPGRIDSGTDWTDKMPAFWGNIANQSNYIYSIYANYESSSSVKDRNKNLPSTFALYSAYPNPFNPITNIEFYIPTESKIKLQIFDVKGKLISTLVDKRMRKGKYKTVFNATNLASGVYIYKLQSGNFSVSKKLILLK